jgi:hypothetical protein
MRVWDAEGEASDWSELAWFEMGLLQPEDWQARWIAMPGAAEPGRRPAPCFRREFEADGRVAAARVYVCGLGYYELYLDSGWPAAAEVAAPQGRLTAQSLPPMRVTETIRPQPDRVLLLVRVVAGAGGDDAAGDLGRPLEPQS